MDFLIIGGSGLVGCELADKFKKVSEVSFTFFSHPAKMDGCKGFRVGLEDSAPIVSLIGKLKPQVVIHAAAPSSVDSHEREKEKSYRINAVTTRAIAEKTSSIGAKLVYISTSNVFPPSSKPFYENDIPAPINFYGACKLGGELATMQNPNHLILRTDQIYGWNKGTYQKKSFVVSTLEKLEAGMKVEVCEDWYNCPTYAPDIADALDGLIKKGKKGIYHTVGSSYLNRVEWARKIAHFFGKDERNVLGIKSNSLNLPAVRSNVKLDNSKIQKETKAKMHTVDEGLALMEKSKRFSGWEQVL